MVFKQRAEHMMEAPSATQLVRIKREIGEDDDRLKNTEQLLYQWIESQPHFPKKYDKAIVRSFLRGSKHNFETTKRRLENNFTVKVIYPEIFLDRSAGSKEVVKALEIMNMVYLPKLTKEGYRIVILRVKDQDASKMDLNLMFKVFFMLYDVVLKSPHPIAGDIVIFDNENINSAHILKMFSPLMRSMIKVLREAYSIRLRRMHLVNSSTRLDKILSFIKPLLHHKVRDNILLHENVSSLHELYGDVLPSNYGGLEKDLDQLQSDLIDELNRHAEWLEELESMKITGSKPKDFENSSFSMKDQMGLEGCFRKLEID